MAENRIRDLRKKAGITPERASCALGVSISTLFSWESGKTTPNGEKLKQMALLYGCSSDALLGLIAIETV